MGVTVEIGPNWEAEETRLKSSFVQGTDDGGSGILWS
jgi:hypothetical protein